MLRRSDLPKFNESYQPRWIHMPQTYEKRGFALAQNASGKVLIIDREHPTWMLSSGCFHTEPRIRHES